MALKVLHRTSRTDSPAISSPQHFTAPSKRDLRAQAVHRLQFGLFGLCAMLLLVGLANIIMNRARLADTGHAPGAVSSDQAKKASDPLADIGVVPAADSSAAAAATGNKAP